MPKKRGSTETKPPKTSEAKAETFVKLAKARTNRALKAIRQLKHLANPSAYMYTPEQIAKVCDALDNAVRELRATFADPKASRSEGFEL